MTIRQKLEILGGEKSTPCITISLKTHRTRPDNAMDVIALKNLLREAERRIIDEYGKREQGPLLKKIAEIEVDESLNLDSLHIFLSNSTEMIIRSTAQVRTNRVQISDTFALRPLIKEYSRNEEYAILLVSQSGVNLYNTLNDSVVEEIVNDDFPFSENRHHTTDRNKGSDPELIDNLVREFLNGVDKAAVRVHNETGLQFVVICTEDNFSRLMQVSDKPSMYLGHANIDYNRSARHQIAAQAWQIVKEQQRERRTEAIKEIKEAIGQGNVLTDLQEIYRATVDGRGDLLMVHQNFEQPVLMNGDGTFEFITDTTKTDAIEDITSNIAWEVLSKKGRVFFTAQDEIKDIGKIVLKTRY